MLLRAVDAARIARLDRNRLNEAIAAGIYPDAPPTVKGRPRLFGFDDVLALYLYADLKRSGFHAKQAGRKTSELMRLAKAEPDKEVISIEHQWWTEYYNIGKMRDLIWLAASGRIGDEA